MEKAQENGGAEAASLLGQTYEALGDYNYAASVYNTYLQNKTPDASLYNQLGLCKLKGGDYEAALAAFQAGLEVEGNTTRRSLRWISTLLCIRTMKRHSGKRYFCRRGSPTHGQDSIVAWLLRKKCRE